MHLLVHSIMCKSARNNESNGGLDVALEGKLHVGLNVALEGAH